MGFRFVGEWIQESVAMERQITMCVFSIFPLHGCLEEYYRSTTKARCSNVVEDGKLEKTSEKDDSMGRLTFSRTSKEEFLFPVASGTSRAGCATWCDNTKGHCLPPLEICSLTFAISANGPMTSVFVNLVMWQSTFISTLTPAVSFG